MNRESYRCHRVEAPFEVDGDLSKPVWSRAPAVTLVDVATGAAPRQATSVRLLHDDENLYLGFHAEDREIWGSHREHDAPVWEENALEIFLDPYGLGRTYYEVAVSPHGVVFDAVIVNRHVFPDGPRDMSTLREWLCEGLKVAVRVDGELDVRQPVSRHWDVELRLPLRQLAPKCLPQRGTMWRMNLMRIDRTGGQEEFQAWSPTGRVDFHMPAYFGGLEFM